MINAVEKLNILVYEYVTKEGKAEGIKVHNKPAVTLEDEENANKQRVLIRSGFIGAHLEVTHTIVAEDKEHNLSFTQENWSSKAQGRENKLKGTII